VDAFDADALIYAAVRDHPLGRRVAAMFTAQARHESDQPDGVGSLLLLPEILGKPLRDGATDEVRVLAGLLGRLDLRPLDRATAERAAALCAAYRMRAADATHLAIAISSGAERFITNNRRDFPKTITEIDVTYPDDLPDVRPHP
jgi:predicted nucleic acid-binding protein